MVGEGEKSGCECGAGETAGDVGVGEGEGACRGGAGGGNVEKGCWSCCRCMSLSSCHRVWHCATEKPTRRATVAQLGRSFGFSLSSIRRQSASPSQASQSALWFSGGRGGCFRLRVVVGCGSGGVVGVSSESCKGGAGERIGGLDGAESQDEVVDGKRMGWLGGVGSG